MALTWKIEEWAKAILQAQQPANIPEAWQISHHDENERADSSRIVLTANENEQELGGPKAYNLTLKVELFATVRDAALVQTIDDAIRAAFGPPVSEVMLSKAHEFFSHIEILNQATDPAEGAQDTRKRVRNIELLAKELVDG